MKELGVDRVIGPCAVGSLQLPIAPGHLLVSDQIVDRTWGRDHTFFDGPETRHLGFADPYCSELRPLAVDACRDAGAETHDGGTVVVIQGPRFSTRAESRDFASSGWEIINMTQAPEAQLIRELELCYVNISVITDYDTGVEGEIEPVSHATVLETFNATLGHSAGSPGPAHPGRCPDGARVPVRNGDGSRGIAGPRSPVLIFPLPFFQHGMNLSPVGGQRSAVGVGGGRWAVGSRRWRWSTAR